jgi:hypothetical protein
VLRYGAPKKTKKSQCLSALGFKFLWAGDAGFEPVTFGAGVKESGVLAIPQLTENKQKIQSLQELAKHRSITVRHLMSHLQTSPCQLCVNGMDSDSRVKRRQRLGGMLNFYCREAAW